MYTRRDFGAALETAVLREVNLVALSKWAYRIFLDNVHDLEPGARDAIMRVVVIEEGPEFQMSRDELLEMAVALQGDPGTGS